MNKFYIILLALLSLTGMGQTKQELKEAFKKRDKYLFAAKPLQKNFVEAVPYTSDRDQIIVPVVIGGETYHFLFDTGAITVVSTELKEKLGLKMLFSNNLTDGSGTVQQENFYGMATMQLGSVSFSNVAVAVMDFAKFEKLFCIKLDGIFGTNIMRTCRWKIDYDKQLVTFSDKRIKPEGKVREIDFTENFSGSPLLQHHLGGYYYPSMMDTGFNGGFSIPDSLFFKSRKSKLAYKKSIGNSSMTMYDSKPDDEYIVIMDSLRIDNVFMKNQLVRIAPGDMALTGNEVFKKFGTVIIDWNKLKVYVPDIAIKEDTGQLTYGFGPLFADGVLRVALVWDGSAAQQKGMELGDLITSINGTNTKGMTQETWCGLLELFTDQTEKQRTMALTFEKKDGTERKITLEKYDVFE